MNKQKRDIDAALRCYYKPQCLCAMQYFHDMNLVEDAMQNCIMELWKTMNDRITVSSVSPYLHMMAKNHCLDTLKERQPDSGITFLSTNIKINVRLNLCKE